MANPINRARRELVGALVCMLLGAGLALYTTTQVWWVTETVRPHPLPPLRDEIIGRDEVGWAVALALLTLASIAAVLATRGIGRALVAAVVTLSGLALAWSGGSALAGASRATDAVPAWPGLLLFAGVMVVAGGVVVLRRDRHWNRSTELGKRFQGPQGATTGAETAAEPQSPSQLWDALDAGDDPTDRPESAASNSAR